jgi:chromosome segregation ATPase
LGIGLVGAAMLLAGCGSGKKLEETQRELATAYDEVVAARAETSEVRTQMQAKVDELQQNITKLTEEKADTEKAMSSLKAETEKQISSLKTEMESKQQQLQVRVDTLELDKTNMTSELTVLSQQLAQVNQKLADLGNTHATTVAHLQAMREDYVKLTSEKAALETKLHDLKALKEQISVVKQELHQKKVEESKRLDRAEFAMGNHGFVLKDGTWQVREREPGKYPLSQELYRQP